MTAAPMTTRYQTPLWATSRLSTPVSRTTARSSAVARTMRSDWVPRAVRSGPTAHFRRVRGEATRGRDPR